jgi:hypothetical protein
VYNKKRAKEKVDDIKARYRSVGRGEGGGGQNALRDFIHSHATARLRKKYIYFVQTAKKSSNVLFKTGPLLCQQIHV